VLLPLIRR